MKTWDWQEWARWTLGSIVLPLFIVGVGGYTTLKLHGHRLTKVEEALASHQTIHSQARVDSAQWQAIQTQAENMTVLGEWRVQIDKVVTPEAQQAWGAIQEQVPKNTEDVDELKNRVTRLEVGIRE